MHSLSFEQRRELRIEGGASGTIFPEVAEILEDTEGQESACRLIGEGRGYRSIMDALYCYVTPGARIQCLAYYRGKGPPLRKIIDEFERLGAAYRMLMALKRAFSGEDV